MIIRNKPIIRREIMPGRNSNINRLLIFITVFLCLICGLLFTQSSAGPSGNSPVSVAAKDTQIIPEATERPEASGKPVSLADTTVIPTATATPTPVPDEQKVSPEAENGVWTADGSNWLFMVDGTPYTGWLTDTDGKRYYFDKNGIMQRGWLKLKGRKYYLDEDGIMQTGTVTIDGKEYTFASSGILKK